MKDIELLSEDYLVKEIKKIKKNHLDSFIIKSDNDFIFKEEYKFFDKNKTLIDNNPFFFLNNEFKFYFTKKSVFIENKFGNQFYFDYSNIAYRENEDSPFLIFHGNMHYFSSYHSGVPSTHKYYLNRFSFKDNIFDVRYSTLNIKLPLKGDLYCHPIKTLYSNSLDTNIISGTGCSIGSFKSLNSIDSLNSNYSVNMKYSHLDEILYDNNFNVVSIKLKPLFYKKIKEFNGKKKYNNIQELNQMMNELKEIFPLLTDNELKTRFPDFNLIKEQVMVLSKIDFNFLSNNLTKEMFKSIEKNINSSITEEFSLKKIPEFNSDEFKNVDFLIKMMKYLYQYKFSYEEFINCQEYINFEKNLNHEFKKINSTHLTSKNTI